MREALLHLVWEQALALDGRGPVIVASLHRIGFRTLTEIGADFEARVAERAVGSASDAQIHKLEHINDACMGCRSARSAC